MKVVYHGCKFVELSIEYNTDVIVIVLKKTVYREEIKNHKNICKK